MSGWRPRPPADTPSLSPSTPPGPAVVAALAVVRRELGAARVVLWRLDDRAGVLEPLVMAADEGDTGATGDRSRDAAGDPLAFAVRDQRPLRLDAHPSWAGAPTVAVPLDPAVDAPGEALAVTVHGVDEAVDAGDAAARFAPLLSAVVAQDRREAAIRVAERRTARILDFLHAAASEAEPGALAARFAEVGAALAGADIALLVSLDGDAGEVLAWWGGPAGAPGPEPGTTFQALDGDLALADRSGGVLRREGRATAPVPPLAGAGERWMRRVRHRAVVPLGGALLALGGDRPLDDGVLELLRSLGPLLALQLHHAAALDRARGQVGRDALTGLFNRGALEERLEEERKRFDRYRRPVALLLLDLDHFKRVNDTHGHPAGDAVLQRVAALLRTHVRDVDFVARYGGEEIVVVMPETMLRPAEEAAERVREAVAELRFEWDGTTIPLTVSIGVSACPESVDEPGRLVASADAALYRSKEEGRNRVTLASG